MDIQYTVVSSPEEVDILIGQAATYKSLNFLYTPENIQKYKDLISDNNSFQIIAYDPEGKFAGFVSSSEKIFPGYLFLGELFVNPNFTGKGIGSILVGKVIEFAKQKNLDGVYTETELINEPAQRLYEKCDFQRVDNPNWEGVTYKLQF